ncbi:uncharacterized protein [Euphorbia lathyris]|uniref:uncharacterized protein n=1 Tax=Euphorbia lathyris TaxID=212925 RepID=UPI0033132BAF
MTNTSETSNTNTPNTKNSNTNSPNTDTHITTHPSLTVSNISTFIKITLDIEKGHYPTWAALFKLHAKAFQVLDHIIPTSHPDTDSLQTTNLELRSRIDAVVLQWIYSTISIDLLHTVIEAESSAATAWNRLQDIFLDNKHSRALFLQQEFSKTKLDNFTDISSYCQHLKSLSDQLSNVDCPVTNDHIVLQLTSGLTNAYDTIGTQIRHGDPLPPFHKARSMLIPEETAKSRKNSPSTEPIALIASSVDPAAAPSHQHTARPVHQRTTSSYRGGRHGGRNYRGRGGRHHYRPSSSHHYRPSAMGIHLPLGPTAAMFDSSMSLSYIWQTTVSIRNSWTSTPNSTSTPPYGITVIHAH